MGRALILGALLGGIAAFAWGVVSWTVLSWHMKTLMTFADEAPVAETLRQQTTASGIYVLPYPQHYQIDAHPEVKAEAEKYATEKMTHGPFAFIALSRDGISADMVVPMIYAFVLQTATALLITWLLLQTDGLGYFRRVLFVTVIGVIIGTAGHLPFWIWWHFPMVYTLTDVADAVISWLIAGLFIAAVTGVRRAPMPSFR